MLINVFFYRTIIFYVSSNVLKIISLDTHSVDESSPQQSSSMHPRVRFRFLRLLIPFVMMICVLPLVYLIYTSSLSESSSLASLNDQVIVNEKKPIKILFWTTVLQQPPILTDYCPLESPCTFTTNRQDFETADGVVFHAGDINSRDLPIHRSSNGLQKYVLYSQEAPPSLSQSSRGTFWNDGNLFIYIYILQLFYYNMFRL